MTELKKPRLLVQLLLAGVFFVSLAAVALIGLWIASHRRPSGPVNVVLRNQLVGTWVGEHAVILELRADGSATSRSKVTKTEPQHLEWTVSGNELTVFTATQNRIDRYILNRPVASEEIVEITPDRLDLVDRSTPGKVVRLRYKKLDGAAPANGQSQ